MARFAEVADLEAFLQTEVNLTTAELVLDIASGTIRSHVGWSITEEIGAVLVTQGTGGDVIWLPTKRLTDVISVVEDGDPLIFGDHYRWTTSGRLRRIGSRWPCEEQSVEVTFTHGDAVAPDDVKGVSLALASRLFNNPEGLRSYSLDGVSETATISAASLGMTLTDQEKTALDPYVLTGVA